MTTRLEETARTGPASAAHPTWLDATSRHVPALDGLRCLAVLLVFGVHGQFPHAQGGSVGVDIFFVLSGFLITQILSREYLRTGRLDLVAFYANRFLRLFPAMALMSLGFLLYCAHLREWQLALDNLVPSVTYIADYTRSAFQRPSALGHMWSLAIEEQFYVLWPTLLLGLRRRGAADRDVIRWLGLGVAAVVLWRFFLFTHGAAVERIYDGFDTHADGLLIGCMLGLAPKPAVETMGRFWPLGLAALLAWVAAGRWDSPLLYKGGFLLVALCAATLVAGAATRASGPLARTLAFGPVRWLGRVSYGMYLWHFPIIIALQWSYRFTPQGAMLVGAPASALIASASYLLVERPLLAKRQTLPRWGKRCLATAGPTLLLIGICYRIGLGAGYLH
jgi:peptidoglycan/LPS O-acetylase OafA/YrhL